MVKIKTILIFFCLIFFVHTLEAKIKIVTTLSVLESVAQQIGKDKVETDSLFDGRFDPHFIDARPDYIMKLVNADLLLYIGLDLEIGWLPKLIEQSRNPKIYINNLGNCDVSRGVYILEKPVGQVDRSLGDIHIYGNPHYWLDPLNIIIIARNIKENLIKIDSQNGEFYEKNYIEFSSRIKNFTLKKIKEYEHLKNLKVVVQHREFVYFLSRFGIKEEVSLEEKMGVPPSAAYLKKVIEKIRNKNIKLILRAPYNDPKYSDFVAKNTNAKVVVLPTNTIKNQIESYEDLIDEMLRSINNAIQQ